MPRTRLVLAFVVSGCIGLSSASVSAQAPDRFTLGRYIPADCWMYVHGVGNPEAKFLCEHWSRVFKAVRNSGVGADFKTLMLSFISTPEERAQFETFWARATELVQGVKWGDLVKREFAVAERFSGPLPVPDVFFLCRSEPATLESNVAGLKAILDSLASLQTGASVVQETLQGVNVWSLNLVNIPFTLHLFHKDDVVGIVMGRRALEQTLALMSGAKGETAIVDAPRFRQAIGEVPPPEDAVMFFDLRALFADIQKQLQPLLSPATPTSGPGTATNAAHDPGNVMRVMLKVLDGCDVFEYVVMTGQTEGLQQTQHNVGRLQPDHKNKPLGRILGSPQPFERFDRYVPVDATAFNAFSGIDLAALYHEVLGFIRTCPDGDKIIAEWDAIQTKIGLNLDADLFSWLGGQCVTFTLPATMATAFGKSPDSVLMVRVKDSKLATDKLNAGITRLNALLTEHGQTLMITPAEKVGAPGFQNVTHPLVMMFLRLTVGVSGDWMILGSSESAVNKALDVAAGKEKTILDNPRFKAEGVVPTGPVCSASFKDLSNMGQELSTAMSMMGFFAISIPDEPGARPVKAIFSIMAKLAPALAEMDFFRSASSAQTFDGQAWTAKSITTYKPPRPAETAPAATAPAAATPAP